MIWQSGEEVLSFSNGCFNTNHHLIPPPPTHHPLPQHSAESLLKQVLQALVEEFLLRELQAPAFSEYATCDFTRSQVVFFDGEEKG